MRKQYDFVVEIPEGVEAKIENGMFSCKKGEAEVSKVIEIPGTEIKVAEGKVTFSAAKVNKKGAAMVRTGASHVQNMFKGLSEKFVYKLEVCNVHFPMTVKAEGDKVVIGNFLGEKTNRTAKILKGVDVEIKGSEITVSGHDLEKTGQTAANLEQASKVPKKDKRVFQDGIFMTEKPGRII